MTDKSTLTESTTAPSFSMKLLVAGVIASLVMAMWEMIVEAILPTGAGFWAAPVMIAAAVLRDLQDVAIPVPFTLVGVVVGMIGHMMNSIIFAIIFALWIVPRIPSLVGQIVAGMVYGLVIFVVMSIFTLIGYLGMTGAFVMAPVGVVAPFEYTVMIFAVISGYLNWGDVPDAYVWTGAAIIVTSGVYMIYRESRLATEEALLMDDLSL